MTNPGNSSESTANREIVITRVINAPRELVWEAITDPKQVGKWWGPRGFSTTIEKMEVKPGGIWKHTMHGPDGTDYPNHSTFLEIVKPERLVYSAGGAEKTGREVSFVSTWTFEVVDANTTKVTMRGVFPTPEERERVIREYGADEGGKQTLARLGEYLAEQKGATTTQPQFTIVREFDAPRELVFKAWTDPEALTHWWGPSGFTMTFAKTDIRPGGLALYRMKGPRDFVMWGKMLYREIVNSEKICFVVSFSDEKGGTTRHPMSATWPLETLSTISFTAKDGKTIVRLEAVPVNATEDERQTFLDGHESMQKGYGGTMDQLDRYLTLT